MAKHLPTVRPEAGRCLLQCGVDSEQDIEQVERSADALVLTEWKIIHSDSDVSAKIKEAKLQAKRYSQGSLGGIELTNYRYLVIVSKKVIKTMPEDVHEDGVTYRNINIAVDPDSPSKG